MKRLFRLILVLGLGFIGLAQTTGFVTSTPSSNGITGGTCTGGQVMGGISTAGVPTCVTPSGGSGFPSGNSPQIGGFAAANTSEAETVTGDFTFTRAGANSYTATVTKIGGVTPGGTCTGGQFVSTISASGVPTCTAPTVGAPLTNPAAGQNNYAPLASPTFTGTVTSPNSLENGAVWFGSTTTPNGFITSLQPTNINIAAGAHRTGANWVADSTNASLVVANANSVGFFTDQGLTVGNTYNPTQVGVFTPSGFTSSIPVTVNGTIYANSHGPSGSGSFNTVSNSIVVASGSHGWMAINCSGVFIVSDQSVTGDTAVYISSAGYTTFIASAAGGAGPWVASTTAPAAGKASVAADGTNYSVYNNQGSTVQYGIASFCTRGQT